MLLYEFSLKIRLILGQLAGKPLHRVARIKNTLNPRPDDRCALPEIYLVKVEIERLSQNSAENGIVLFRQIFCFMYGHI